MTKPRDYGELKAQILDLLRRYSPRSLTRIEIDNELDLPDKATASSCITQLHKHKLVHIKEYRYFVGDGSRPYPRAAYRIGPGRDAMRPAGMPKRLGVGRTYPTSTRPISIFHLAAMVEEQFGRRKSR